MLGAGAYRALADVLDERRRQVEVLGYTAEHDDEYGCGELAAAAGCYADFAGLPDDLRANQRRPPTAWPWLSLWWKPTTPRADLVKAAALILAEIERLDRKTS